jgi:hypothetical protein
VVLGCLGAMKPAFPQGALHYFRHCFVRCDMDRRLLERTAQLARKSKDFDSIRSALVEHVISVGGEAICKPWAARNKDGKLFTRAQFRPDLPDLTIICADNDMRSFRVGAIV